MSNETRRPHGPPRRHVDAAAAKALRKIVRANEKIQMLEERIRAAQDERTAAYLAARQLDPPVTYRAIAEAIGLTDAAVMVLVKKAEAAAES